MNNVKQLVILSFCASVLIVGKIILVHLPNIEVVTFLLIIYTLVFKLRYTLTITLVYSIIEFLLWGIQGVVAPLWFIIVLVTYLLKGIFKENFLLWSILSGLFGLSFGLMYAVTLFLISEMAAFSRIIFGLPYDAIHMVGNYFIMLLLGNTTYKRLKLIIGGGEYEDLHQDR